MASLLGNLIMAGLATLLTTQASLGSINAVPNMYTIVGGQSSTYPPDVALFQPSSLGQPIAAGLGAGIGLGAHTLNPFLYTRASDTSIWYNPNTTAMPGDLLLAYWHSKVR